MLEVVSPDATPLHMRDAGGKATWKSPTKVMQAQYHIVIMSQDKLTKELKVWRTPLPCKLLRTLRGTAGFVRDCHGSATYAPLKEGFFKRFPLTVRLEMLDRDAANVKHPRHEEALAGFHLSLDCTIHMLHGIAQRVYLVCGCEVSGLIALALTIRQAGAFKSCKTLSRRLSWLELRRFTGTVAGRVCRHHRSFTSKPFLQLVGWAPQT